MCYTSYESITIKNHIILYLRSVCYPRRTNFQNNVVCNAQMSRKFFLGLFLDGFWECRRCLPNQSLSCHHLWGADPKGPLLRGTDPRGPLLWGTDTRCPLLLLRQATRLLRRPGLKLQTVLRVPPRREWSRRCEFLNFSKSNYHNTHLKDDYSL